MNIWKGEKNRSLLKENIFPQIFQPQTTPPHSTADNNPQASDPIPNVCLKTRSEKPRVIVLGSGWAACRILRGLNLKMFDIVAVSPRNHMVFTPLLASTGERGGDTWRVIMMWCVFWVFFLRFFWFFFGFLGVLWSCFSGWRGICYDGAVGWSFVKCYF